MLVRCDACLGMKEIMKAGMFRGPCEKCHGVGQIKESDLGDHILSVAAEPKKETVLNEDSAQSSDGRDTGKKKGGRKVSIVES